ncbi:hypothetical protein SDC9_155561 [bioreactor metagenome]|uniref:Phage minor structural protein GP20 n=1 Tax=bioreactor metagenome TaxID=1076179 RepID=A0A645F4C1_9ZZZZ|nr:phage scaffolding protein [Candidatus Metalachnospira sp.]
MKHAWLKEILGDNYTDELDKKVDEKLTGLYVAKQDYDTKVNELSTANTSITNLTGQLKAFDGVDVTKLKDDVTKWETKYNSDIAAVKRDSAIDMAIVQAKGRNSKAIKALLDMDKIKLKDDGTLDGLDIEGLKKSDAYLFDVETKKNIGGGFEPGEVQSSAEEISAMIDKAMGIKSSN